MTSQQIISKSEFTEYETGCYALEFFSANTQINVAIDDLDEVVEFELNVNNVDIELTEEEKQIVLAHLRNEIEEFETRSQDEVVNQEMSDYEFYRMTVGSNA